MIGLFLFYILIKKLYFFENKNIEKSITEKYLKDCKKDKPKTSMPLVLDDAYLLSLIFENDSHLEETELLKVA